MIIFDSSPLIHITKIGKIEFVLKLFEKIYIPEGVHKEVVKKGLEFGYADAFLIQNYENKGKIIKLKVEKNDPTLINFLHRGEIEVLLLGKKFNEKKKCLIVMDEKKGRLIAEQRKISYISTAGLILLLLRYRIINYNLYCSNLAKYSSNGWFSHQNYQNYIKRGKIYE
ncbi:hypothetical protein [Candidatus Harpocratesius sp.]